MRENHKIDHAIICKTMQNNNKEYADNGGPNTKQQKYEILFVDWYTLKLQH